MNRPVERKRYRQASDHTFSFLPEPLDISSFRTDILSKRRKLFTFNALSHSSTFHSDPNHQLVIPLFLNSAHRLSRIVVRSHKKGHPHRTQSLHPWPWHLLSKATVSTHPTLPPLHPLTQVTPVGPFNLSPLTPVGQRQPIARKVAPVLFTSHIR